MSEQTSTLSPVAQKFILHWGEMGARWGVNRTVAQVHALLFLSPRPLNAEEIANTLRVARSNVSTSLRELQGWRIVRAVSVLGDRRQHFETLKDLWEMFRVIMEERKRRELDPTVAVVRECAAELQKSGPAEAYTRERLVTLLDFLTILMSLYEELERLSPGAARKLLKLRGKMRKLLRG
jgi:DNA-binding transcriptional regulator GbsR (MarR family)